MAIFGARKNGEPELEALRELLLDSGLTEELKWGKPCYTLAGKNVAILMTLKEACALMFCKGALLRDGQSLLAKPGEHTQAGRWMKFGSVAEVARRANAVKAYLAEATEVERAGLEVVYKETAEFAVPAELTEQLEKNAKFKAAFGSLTPGRQRGYLLHFAGAKQSKTRTARVAKWRPHILQGKGLHDE